MSILKVFLISAALALAALAVVVFGAAPASAQSTRAFSRFFDSSSSHIGVAVRDLDPAEAERQKLEGGVVVDDVEAGSAADKAGIKQGDIVVEFDSERIRSAR